MNDKIRPYLMPDDGWHHIVPIGEFKHPETGTLQVIDEKAILEMERRFNQEQSSQNFPGMLVDFDHFSHDADKPSEAAGWIEAVRSETAPVQRTGLWARIRWSDSGEAAVRGGRYRLVSPVWLADDCESVENRADGTIRVIRPLRLYRLALTNDPRLKGMVPLSHRERPLSVNQCTLAGNPPFAEIDPIQQKTMADGDSIQPQPKEPMKVLTQILGLPDGASHDNVAEEITRLKNRATDAENLAQQLRRKNEELLTVQVQQDLDRFSSCIKPETRAKWQAALMANRCAALELLESINVEHKPKQDSSNSTIAASAMHHRASAKPPCEAQQMDSKPEEQRKQVRAYQNRLQCSWQEAWDAVKAEHPHLFNIVPGSLAD